MADTIKDIKHTKYRYDDNVTQEENDYSSQNIQIEDSIQH